MHEFVLERWAACAPGLDTLDDWRAWAAAPTLPHSQFANPPPLSAMPAMLRRRLNVLGRAALQAAYEAQGDAPPMPLITASRHGDLERSAQLLQSLAADEALSPTDFSLSVFNAIAGLYSIACHGTLPTPPPYTSVAAGANAAEAALTEALAQCAEAPGPVLVLVYDAPLPAVYSHFINGPECLFAWAWQVRARRPTDRAYLSLRRHADHAPAPTLAWPQALEVLRFALSEEAELVTRSPGQSWRWTRHA